MDADTKGATCALTEFGEVETSLAVKFEEDLKTAVGSTLCSKKGPLFPKIGPAW